MMYVAEASSKLFACVPAFALPLAGGGFRKTFGLFGFGFRRLGFGFCSETGTASGSSSASCALRSWNDDTTRLNSMLDRLSMHHCPRYIRALPHRPLLRKLQARDCQASSVCGRLGHRLLSAICPHTCLAHGRWPCFLSWRCQRTITSHVVRGLNLPGSRNAHWEFVFWEAIHPCLIIVG